MRKITVLAVAVTLAGLVGTIPAQAEDSGMLEISGNIVTVTGWQRAKTGAYLDTTAGILGDGLGVSVAPGTEEFGFLIDQVEIDLAKSFGENIRFRADLDFFPFNGGFVPGRLPVGAAAVTGGTHDFLMEQAYTTANIPAGNGWELLVGRFNSGIGLDPVDRNELSTVSHSSIHRVLIPHNLTGARLGYNWTDSFRWETFVVNNLADALPAGVAAAAFNSTLPSMGFNAIYTYGDESNMSWWKFTGAGGPEQLATNKHWSFLGDLAVSHAATDAFRLGVEGVYRQDNAAAAATDNNQYIAGTLQAMYAFSDVWDGTLRYGFTWDLDALAGGAPAIAANNTSGVGLPLTLANGGVRHDLALAAGYAITDGARFGLEGRFDMTNPSAAANAAANSNTTGQNIGLAGTFAYNF